MTCYEAMIKNPEGMITWRIVFASSFEGAYLKLKEAILDDDEIVSLNHKASSA